MTRTDPRLFLYRSLDPDGARRLAARHLGGCDDGELYLQYSASESFGFDDGRLKTADYHTSSGFGLRGVTGETTAFAHANAVSAAQFPHEGSTRKEAEMSEDQLVGAVDEIREQDIRLPHSSIRPPRRSAN